MQQEIQKDNPDFKIALGNEIYLLKIENQDKNIITLSSSQKMLWGIVLTRIIIKSLVKFIFR